MNETAAALVDGDTHTCSSVDQMFWAVDLGFNMVVDDVTILSANFAGNTHDRYHMQMPLHIIYTTKVNSLQHEFSAYGEH